MPTKKKIYPMLEKIDLTAVPEAVLAKTFNFLNYTGSALEIVEMTGRHADYIQGVTTGEKVAASILLMRDKVGGAFTKLAELQGVAYFTEDKLKTLLAVFYIEAGVWQTTAIKKAPLDESSKALEPQPEPIIQPRVDPLLIPIGKETEKGLDPQALQTTHTNQTLEPQSNAPGDQTRVNEPLLTGELPPSEVPIDRQSGSNENPTPPPTENPPPMEENQPETETGVKGGGSGLLGGKEIAVELALMGRLANASPKVSFKGYADQLSYLGANAVGSGNWKLLFKSNFTSGTAAVSLRLDFEEGGSHVLAVTTLWNPLASAPIVVRL